MTIDNPNFVEGNPNRPGSNVGRPGEIWFVAPNEIPEILSMSKTEHVRLEGEKTNLELEIRMETRAADIASRVNEDAPPINIPMGEGRRLVGVLDGASSQASIPALKAKGVKGAYYASHLTYLDFPGSRAHEILSGREQLTAGDVMRGINSWLHGKLARVEGVDYSDVTTIPGMSATLALIDASKQVITTAHVADTLGFVETTHGQLTRFTHDQNARFDRETLDYLQTIAYERGVTLAEALKMEDVKRLKHEQLKESFGRKINTPGGCGILNGMPELPSNALIYENRVPVTSKLARIAIFSDGATLPYHQPGLDDDDVIKAMAVETREYPVGEGFKFLDRVSELLKEDPGFEKHPRLRDDDKTALEVRFV